MVKVDRLVHIEKVGGLRYVLFTLGDMRARSTVSVSLQLILHTLNVVNADRLLTCSRRILFVVCASLRCASCAAKIV